MRSLFRSIAVVSSTGLLLSTLTLSESHAQPTGYDGTVAQYWNEACLKAISRDFARPTVHARNLFHTSMAIYDAWAAYDQAAEPYLLGRTLGNYTSTFHGVQIPDDPEELRAAREAAISFAVYRLVRHRFQNSPGGFLTLQDLNQRMNALGLDILNTSTDYLNGGAPELGNYIAQQIITFGFTDGSNESANFANQFYQPLNPNILPEQAGTNGILDPNRWQAISLSVAIDQSGNLVSDPPHLTPEWGNVLPFSMTAADKTVKERDGHMWNIYMDPGAPPMLDTTDNAGLEAIWKWGFCLVSLWQSHLDPNDPTLIDASPNSIGNIQWYPETFDEHPLFYDLYNGGTLDAGHSLNPVTGEPYATQVIKRSDYGRVVAEFWADGPNSYTPPGHWFHIYNEIRHHELWENKWNGQGPELDALEYDAKAYLSIGGAMHDAAITAWGIKGYYDYVRPVSAIRYMCEKGQCSNPDAANYHPAGMPLIPGLVEQVLPGDPLAGENDEHLHKTKLYTWKGPDYIENPHSDYAGVGWILGEEWWPYQRPTFVTPPFAGYISGHSTFSRTAAEVLTLMTGSPFFPGGMSNFHAPKDEFLEFEIGPTEDVYLQWATYMDASDQCSLSRIWGGIHPPADDIPGRLIGMELGPKVFQKANTIFTTDRPIVASLEMSKTKVGIEDIGSTFTATVLYDRPMNVAVAPAISFLVNDPLLQSALTVTNVGWIDAQSYRITYQVEQSNIEMPNIMMRIANAVDQSGESQNVFLRSRPFRLDTKRPALVQANVNNTLLNDSYAAGEGLIITLQFTEACNEEIQPAIDFEAQTALDGVLSFNAAASTWISATTFEAHFQLSDTNEEISGVAIAVNGVEDLVGNNLLPVNNIVSFDIDTRNPLALEVISNTPMINIASAGANALSFTLTFDKAMDTNVGSIGVGDGVIPPNLLSPNGLATGWVDPFTYTGVYNQNPSEIEVFNIPIELQGFRDLSGNEPAQIQYPDMLGIDTRRPLVSNINPTNLLIADADVAAGLLEVEVQFDEAMNVAQLPLLQLTGAPNIGPNISYNPFQSNWLSETTFKAAFNLSDQNVEMDNIALQISFGSDLAGNNQQAFTEQFWLDIDTKNPEISAIFASTYTIGEGQLGEGTLSILLLFNEPMNQGLAPALNFEATEDLSEIFNFNAVSSAWQNAYGYQAVYDIEAPQALVETAVDLRVESAFDLAGNEVLPNVAPGLLSIELEPLSAGGSNALFPLNVYPNPMKNGEALRLQNPVDLQQVRIGLFAMDGKKVYEVFVPHLYAGTHQFTPRELAQGVYQLQLSSPAFTGSARILVVD